jgi:hypothetical protein
MPMPPQAVTVPALVTAAVAAEMVEGEMVEETAAAIAAADSR